MFIHIPPPGRDGEEVSCQCARPGLGWRLIEKLKLSLVLTGHQPHMLPFVEGDVAAQ